MKNALIGASGFAHEVQAYLGVFDIPMFVDEEYWTGKDKNVFKMSDFDPDVYQVLIALGSSQFRSDISKRMPENTTYFSFIHPLAYFIDSDTDYREGSIFCPGSMVSINVAFGKQCQLNMNTTIGHGCKMGDFFTTAPGVNISGDCVIGDRVYIGTNSAVHQKIHICDDVMIGMGAVVVKDILKPGTYVGNPARRLE